MKNIIKFLILILIFTSCEDKAKSPLIASGNEAPFVKFIVSNSQIDLGDSDSAYSGTFEAVNPDLIEKHEVFVALENTVITPNYVLLTTITSFPYDFSVTIPDVANVLGMDVSDFLPGNKLKFECVTTGVDGTTISRIETIDNADGETGSAAQQQGYSFEGVMICPPFAISDLLGMYNVTQNRLAAGLGVTDPNPVREVIAGPGTNQVTIVGGSVGFAGGDDLIVDVDTTTGALSLGLDASGYAGLAFPDTIIGFGSDYDAFADGGLTLTCLPTVTMNMPVTLTCCGGVWTLTLEKQ